MLSRWIRSTVARTCLTAVVSISVITATLSLHPDAAQARRRSTVHVVKKSRLQHGAMAHRAAPRPAADDPRFSTIVVDVKAGRSLYEVDPDGLRHPASVTKVMTLFMLFQQLQNGRLRLDSELAVSEHAALQAPTKLGLKPGSTLRVDDAIKGMVTRSANDAAVVVAEAIGGSEDNFAAMMTRQARSLGMTRTVYRNASGLPDPGQITTARDLAVLGVAIQDRFPNYYSFFSTRNFVFRGRDIANHNHLLGAVEGVDGIKTGYTRASGFNLLTSVKRDGRQLIAVVMGGRSGSSRDAIMRELIANALPRASAGARQGQSPFARTEALPLPAAPAQPVQALARTDPPSQSSQTLAQNDPPAPPAAQTAPLPGARIRAAVVADTPKPKADGPVAPSVRFAALALPAPPAPPESQPRAPAPARPAVAFAAETGPILRWVQGPAPVTTAPATPPARVAHSLDTGKDATSSVQLVRTTTFKVAEPVGDAEPLVEEIPPGPTKAPSVKAPPETARSGWVIQIGATDNEPAAKRLLDKARSAGRKALTSAEPFTESVERNGTTLWRARFAGFDDQREAQAACNALKSKEFACMAARL